MKDSYYFSHDGNARNDPKIKAMRKKHKMMGYGIYWVIIEMMRESEDYTLPLKEYIFDAIAEETGKDVSFIKHYIEECVEQFELFKRTDDCIYSESLLNRMAKKDEITEMRRRAGLASAEARRKTTGVQELSTSDEQVLNTPEQVSNNKSKVKERKGKKLTKENNIDGRKRLFQEKTSEYIPQYGKEMIGEFVDYWTEPNPTNTKMRYELEKTWDLSRRLSRWAANQKTFKKPDKPPNELPAAPSYKSSNVKKVLEADYDDPKFRKGVPQSISELAKNLPDKNEKSRKKS